MKTQEGEFLRDFLLDQLEREYGNTRKLLAAIPETAAVHRPHPESMSTLDLARHLVEAELVLLECIAAGSLDHMQESQGVPDSLPKLVAHYETRFPAAIAGVRALDSRPSSSRWRSTAASARVSPTWRTSSSTRSTTAAS
jgi:hypothetical protein